MTLDELKGRVDKNIPSLRLADLWDDCLWSPMLLATMLPGPKKILEAFEILPLSGAVFVGKPGNGRHTAARALAASTCNPKIKNCPHYLRVTGWDFDGEKIEDAVKTADFIVDIGKEYNSLCLFIDSPEESRFGKQVQYRLASGLREAGISAFVIIVTGDEKFLCRELTEYFKVCHCTNPTKSQREEWIKENFTYPTFVPVEKMSHEEIAEKTKDFSWKQLNDMLESMRQVLAWRHFKLYKKNNKSEQLLKDAIETGKIYLTHQEAEQIIESIASQNPAPPAAGQVQVVTAENPVKNKTEEVPVQKGAEESLREKAEFHKKPEQMTFTQLIDI